MRPTPIPPPELRKRMMRAWAVLTAEGKTVEWAVCKMIAESAPTMADVPTTTRDVIATCKKRGIIVDYVNVKRVLRG